MVAGGWTIVIFKTVGKQARTFDVLGVGLGDSLS
jgi:hypothetical protein